jgi:class 3 adenylate cyclase
MTVVVERNIECASDARSLWCVITDTERLNRAVGLGPIELTDNDDDTAARHLVKTVSGGFALEYEERPYEWVENRRFRVRREVRKGAAKLIDNAFALDPVASGGTKLSVRITVEPRYAVLKPFIRAQVNRFANKLAREFRRIDAEIHAGRPAGFNLDGAKIHHARLEQASERLLRSVPEAQRGAARRIAELVATEPDANVDRIRPFELADRWSLDDRSVLAACLHGVRAGLLELRWDLVCPSCVNAADRIGTLADIGSEGHCQLCDITFDLALDSAVEATFRPAEAVRVLDEGPYCIGGPARTPHVVQQAILAADGSVELRAPDTAGSYRLFVRGGVQASLEVREGGEPSASVRFTPGVSELGALVLAPGAALQVTQRGGSERHVKIERVGWKSRAATAAVIATLPEFRRFFSSEVLRRGSTLRVGRVALLFTDLTASTELYKIAGDARAFKVVQDHFDLLGQLIADHRGAIVKTMGDAVMAAFVDEADALGAAVAIQRAFPAFRDQHEEATGCFVKVGVYEGPCYAVTANGILDYFGQTVNVAARLQAEAKAGELVVVKASYDAYPDDELRAAPASTGEATLKGVGRVEVVHVRLDQPS